MELKIYGQKLKQAAKILRNLSTNDKNQGLEAIRDAILGNMDYILVENQKDIEIARENGTSESLIDRLTLTESRLRDIAHGVDNVIKLPDPVHVVRSGKTLANGIEVLNKTVPIGVLSMIYESRPNVTVDAAVLAIKSGNTMLLRGSSSAFHSNVALEKIMRSGLEATKVPVDSIMLLADTDRAIVKELLQLDEYIDLIIPRGGASLIDFVTKNATVPTIETGVGNCHLYIDCDCEIDMALNILENGKTSRPSVCNALESVLIHVDVAAQILPLIVERMGERVEFYGCEKTRTYISCNEATNEHYATEFLDYVLAIKVVANIDEAIEHIDTYSSGHSECIVTNNHENAVKFTKEIDSACVYVNASTRFTDGFEFGLGAEIGISTQKMHARGPMGLEHLVSNKYVIFGEGQIR